MTAAARGSIRKSIDFSVDNLKPLANKAPSAGVEGDDFNRLLKRAQETFSDVPGIADIAPVTGSTTMGELMLKLSLLQGAVHSWFSEQTRRSVEEHNRRNQSRNPWR